MKQTQHTPGPWIIEYSEEGDNEITTQSRLDESFVGICTVDTGFDYPIRAEQEANLLLIAAAPDLLEALKKAREGLICTNEQVPHYAAIIDAAISKAEGGAK